MGSCVRITVHFETSEANATHICLVCTTFRLLHDLDLFKAITKPNGLIYEQSRVGYVSVLDPSCASDYVCDLRAFDSTCMVS